MSAFLESSEYDPKRFVQTEHGFVLESETMPRRKDVLWKNPLGHIYFCDGDEWVRLSPPDRRIYNDKNLNHG